MDLPLVSVICNCYNHAPYVVEAIQSIQKQSYKNIEILVLNNGSIDNSYQKIKEYLENYPEIQFVHWEKSRSITIAFNEMVKLSNGDFLIDLSADDMLLPHCVERQIEAFLKGGEEVGVVFGNAYSVNEKGENRVPFFDVDTRGKVLDKRLLNTDYLRLQDTGKTLCSVSSMMSKKHFLLLGGYDETLFFEDLDYWYRLSRKYKIIFIDDFLVDRRVLPHSLGAQMDKKQEYSKKIHQSIIKIYRDAISYNSPLENRMLLKRIHYGMDTCFKNKLYAEVWKYTLLELLCRWKIMVAT